MLGQARDVRSSGQSRPRGYERPLPKLVESRCGAVALGKTYLLPPLSFGGASMVPRWLRFHIHRVTGGGRPPPVPTERGVRLYRTTLFGSWFTALQAPAASRKGGAV